MSAIVLSFTHRTGAAASTHNTGDETSRTIWGTSLLRWCAQCSVRSRQRHALAQLDDRLLKDIGVTRRQALAEAGKPFWK